MSRPMFAEFPIRAKAGFQKMRLPIPLIAWFLFLAVLTGCISTAEPGPSPISTDSPPFYASPANTSAPSPAGADKAIEANRPPATLVNSMPGLSSSAPSAGVPALPLTPAEIIPTPPERDLYRLAKELIPGLGEIERVEGSPAPTFSVGHRQSFELIDLQKLERYRREFELRLVTPNAYWFVEEGLRVDQEDIVRSAAVLEDTIYPRITQAFGSEWKPGIDGDSHLYVLNASLNLVGGYYSPADEYPKEIRPVSNEIEAIYINVRYLPIGTDDYSVVLAHELQHAIHWNADSSEASWFNEGLSELAVTIAGYSEASILAFRRAGPTSLTVWPADGVGGAENYGAASLFMHYFTEHYGDRTDLRPLLSLQADGIEAVNAYLERTGSNADFTDVFRDWAVANLLDEDMGHYGYGGLRIGFPVYRSLENEAELQSSLPQYANEYVRLELPASSSTLYFEGNSAAAILPVDAREGCWWSNNGDDIDSTLTAYADLRDVDWATLDYQVWHAIEENWDYAYLEVSANSGETWEILETTHTSNSNPLASAFGPGYTGFSEEWVDESVPLDKWAGQEILLRFQYITDAAVYDHGLCLRNLQVSRPPGERVSVDWQPNGFVWTNNLVRQRFIVQVIYDGQDDTANRVLQLELNASNSGEITLQAAPEARRVVAVVQSMAPSTRINANYVMRLESVE